MKVLVDTAVVMYAGGAEHPLREPCRQVIRSIVRGDVEGYLSAEVVQEILHRFTRAADVDRGIEMARLAADLFGPVLPLDQDVLDRMLAMLQDHPTATARDLVHAATCLVAGLDALVTPDRDFDAFSEVRRIDPTDWVA